MNITISGRHISITSTMKTAANKQLSKVTNHFPAQHIKMIVEIIKKETHVSVSYTSEHGQIFHAEAQRDTYASAVKDVQGKLLRQLKANKTNHEKLRKSAHVATSTTGVNDETPSQSMM